MGSDTPKYLRKSREVGGEEKGQRYKKKKKTKKKKNQGTS